MDCNRQPYTFDRVVSIVITLSIVIAVLLCLYSIRGVLLPFLVACLIAYLINPLIEWNKHILRLRKRTFAIFITFIEIILALTLVGLLVIPMIIDEIHHLYILISVYIQTSPHIPLLPEPVQEFIHRHITLESIGILLSHKQWIEIGQITLQQLHRFITISIHNVASALSWGIVLLYVFFILQDYQAVVKVFLSLVPHQYRPMACQIGNDIKNNMNQYIRGQALIATIVGVLHCIGFMIIGLPMAIPMGILVGILNLIPYMQILSYIPALILCIIGAADGRNFWLLAGLTAIVFIITQIIQDIFLTPRIMGSATGLNPAIILLSLSIWGSLLGFIGLIIALPLTSLILSYYRHYIMHQESSNNNTDTNHTE